jgi:probable O-glycosylation ligase (exosortase A-associated)
LRDYIVLAIVVGAAPVCLFYPYVGILMWSWIAYFNPHRYTWGVAYNFPVAMVIAIPTLIGTFFAKERNRHLFTRETFLLLLFWAWMGISLLHAFSEPLFADHTAEATARMIEVSKIMLMTVLTFFLVTSREKLKYLLIVTALSLGFHGIKGAIFGILTGGQFRVWGPPNSFVADNNDLGLALNMTLPMLFFLTRDEENRTWKLIFKGVFVGSALSALLTYSRGALLGLSVVVGALSLKSRYKVISIAALILSAFFVVTFAPPAWMARMQGFLNGNLDESAQERLTSWGFAWNFAKHYPVTGGSFETFTPELFALYSPRDARTWLAGHTSSGPHSIYFQVLAEQGFVGLGIFLSLLTSCWFSARSLRKRAARNPAVAWIANYSQIVEISLLAYAVSGAFLGRAYFDLYLQLVAILITLKILYRREVVALQTVAKLESTVETPVQQLA